ncbi:cryptochrome-2-like isoform X3 [Lacerta agilis]|uniref:cryptochrome-2-like isoform X3 n=1 Tax=Lacerta agilis TaxID=80427 RepID=UPI00141A2563|nr:cryptochrome-2-like isoform X3 [Lacerta agilis]
MPHRTIHLFRKGLRLHDNPTLLAALKSSEIVYPVYLLDRNFSTSAARMGTSRWHFLLQTLEDLQTNLKKLNSCLWIIQGEYEAVLREHVQKWNITQVTFDDEIEPYYKEMEKTIQVMGKEMGFEVFSLVGHTLYDVRRIVELNGGTPPLTYKRFLQILTVLGDPEMPVQDITAENSQKLSPLPEVGLAECYRVPLPEDLGFSKEYTSSWRGGETNGLQRLEEHLKNQSKNHSLPPVSLQGQLLWREFFYTVASATPNFTKMVGNPICLQIDWYQDAEKLHKWKTAQTGFPWIDAIMTQLHQEGWIHHLARHAVACFLTRGDLWISWEEGMQVFEELLLDADYSVNAGNWMWLSASAFFHQYSRIFCPVRFGKRTDPEGQYIRKYLPVLKNFPSQYIYEPWVAPEETQIEAGCIIGKDYPFPIVNHKEVSDHNLQLMKQVREEQYKTAQLTRDDVDDPMEMWLKRGCSEETTQKRKLARSSEQEQTD